jgi:hypothetical protein
MIALGLGFCLLIPSLVRDFRASPAGWRRWLARSNQLVVLPPLFVVFGVLTLTTGQR